MSTAAMATPSQLGKYEILERLAAGGMAEVYRGKAAGIAGFERIVAVKRILPKLASRSRFIHSFIDEARIAVSLNHKNIVQVLDFGKSNGELYLVMELIDGVDLRSAAQRALEYGKPAPVWLASHILSEVGWGLDYAHRKSDESGTPMPVVHCDVSPQNVMLSRDGFVKLLDFGVARATISSQSHEGRLRGKPRYMAPEQTRAQTPTPATDVFALGIVAWELFTGLRLFEGENLREVLAAVRRSDAPAVEKLNPDVPPALSQAIATALRVDPSSRGDAGTLAAAFAQTARELADDSAAHGIIDWLELLFPERMKSGFEETSTAFGLERSALSARLRDDATLGAAQPVPVQRSATGQHTLETLVERRRVVAVVTRLCGGELDNRRELSRNLTVLALKHHGDLHDIRGKRPDILEIICVFGLEMAGDENLRDALDFVTSASELARESNAHAPDAIDLRIAACTGVRAVRGDHGYDFATEPIESAARLAEQANPGTPLFLAPRGAFAGVPFEFREGGEDQENTIHELLGRGSARPVSEKRRLGGFFGRSRELAQLATWVREAAETQALVSAAVTGDPGSGKSRLVEEFAEHLRMRFPSALCIHSVSRAAAQDAPFATARAVLATALDMPAASDSELVQALWRVLGRFAVPDLTRDEIVGAFEQALSVHSGSEVSALQPVDAVRDLVAALQRLRRSFPVQARILILEDIQSADPASRQVLDAACAPSLAMGPEFIVVTSRTRDDLPTDITKILVLQALDAHSSTAMTRERMPGASDEAVQTVVSAANGIPLLIEELSASMQEGHGIAGSLQDVVRRKLLNADAATVQTVGFAAIAGGRIRLSLLDELLGAECRDAVHRGQSLGLVHSTDTANLELKSEAVREQVIAHLSDAERSHLHLELGRLLALRHHGGAPEAPAVIATQLAAGGDLAHAAGYACLAGNQALGAHDAKAAMRWFDQALEQLPANDDATRWRAHLGRAHAELELGLHDEVASDLTALRPLSEGHSDRRVQLENLRATLELRLANYEQAIAATRACERAAIAGGHDLARAQALRLRAEAFERTSDFDRAIEASEAAFELFTDLGAASEASHAQVGLGRIHLVRCHYSLARSTYQPVLDGLEHRPNPWLERLARNHLAVVHLCMGEFESAMESATRSLEICRNYGDRAREGDNESVCGLILSEVGLVALAAKHFTRALQIHEDTGSEWSRADTLVYSARNHWRSHHRQQGLAELDEALRQSREIGARYIEANALIARADIHLDSQGAQELERAFDSAAAAEEIATSASLLGARIQALSRLALATWRAGNLASALERSSSAVELLEKQEFIEGSEETIYWVHASLLQSLRKEDEARRSFQRARDIVDRKLSALRDPVWHHSFSGLPSVRAILTETPVD